MALYSERFLINDQPNTWRAVTVPTDTRMVIRSVLIHNGTGVAGLAQIAIGQTVILSKSVPATQELVHYDTRVVAYSSEAVAAYIATAGQVITVSGYLFRDGGALERLPTSDFGALEDVVAE